MAPKPKKLTLNKESVKKIKVKSDVAAGGIAPPPPGGDVSKLVIC
jgi:hypothetical protein